MKKLKKIIKLSDPYPNLLYEVFCYLKTVFGLISIIFGIFLILSPLLKRRLIIFGFQIILSPLSETIINLEERIFGEYFSALSSISGVLLIILGFLILWQIKLIRKLIKVLF